MTKRTQLKNSAQKLQTNIQHAVDVTFRELEIRTSNLPGGFGKSARWAWARRNGARLILITSFAAGLTWAAANHFSIGTPITAAISATLTVQAAVHSSFSNGISRVVATIAGLALAVIMIAALGVNALSIAGIVAASLVAGRLMGLGADGSLQVPATSLGVFIMGVGLDGHMISDRVIGTLFGVVVGVAFSSMAHKENSAEKAARQLGEVNLEVSQLLKKLAEGVSEGVTSENTQEWLKNSRALSERFEDAKECTQEALEAARWSGLRAREEALRLAKESKSLAHSCEQVNSIARTLFDLSQKDKSELLPSGLAGVLQKTSNAFVLSAEKVNETVNETTARSEMGQAVTEIKVKREEAIDLVRDIDDTAVWLLSGSILSDVDRMVESLDMTSPALKVSEADEEKYQIKPRVPVHLRRPKG